MQIFRSILITVLLSAVAVSGAKAEMRHIQGIGNVPYTMLFEEHSASNETLDQFAMRIAPRLREFSDGSGFEACGALASDGKGGFGVVIGTNSSHISCANFSSIVPEGMTALDVSIHSHGKNRPFVPNRADVSLMGQNVALPPKGVPIHGQTLDAFSPADFDGGKGYLAAPGKVLYQSGSREVRVVGS